MGEGCFCIDTIPKMDGQIIFQYFPELSIRQKEQFAALASLYSDWNTRINVVSRKDVEHLYLRHVLHSLSIAKFIEFLPDTRILDVGTGGGFPGIPLAILFPRVNFTLVDSIGKKIKVVREVGAGLGLENVRVLNMRVENHTEQYDFIVSRAVARMDTFVRWTRHSLSDRNRHSIANGILYLKGGELEAELSDFPQAQVVELSGYFEEDFFETKKLVYLPKK